MEFCIFAYALESGLYFDTKKEDKNYTIEN